MNKCKKKIDERNGEKYYLLGTDHDGKKVWLTEASWDCGWYWGFGYITIFTSNVPSRSKDIMSHSHWNHSIAWKFHNKSCSHINENKDFKSTVVDNKESWLLSELMKTFYSLSDIAELYHHGGSFITSNPMAEKLKDQKKHDEINKVILPELFQEVYKLLTP